MPTHTLCHINDIPDNSAKGFNINEHALLIAKQRGNIYAYINNCPHLGLPLEWMPDQFLDAENQYIQCATHGALFRIDNGECISGPCLGDKLQPIIHTVEEGELSVKLSTI